MRKVIVSAFVSLDGVIEDPRWTFRFMSEEQEDFKLDELSASGALLLGRVTCEGFAAAWPGMKERDEVARFGCHRPLLAASETGSWWRMSPQPAKERSPVPSEPGSAGDR